MEEFDYFMIRIRRPTADARERIVSGVVERIGTAEKHTFASGAELLRFVGGEGEGSVNMQSQATSRNAGVAEGS